MPWFFTYSPDLLSSSIGIKLGLRRFLSTLMILCWSTFSVIECWLLTLIRICLPLVSAQTRASRAWRWLSAGSGRRSAPRAGWGDPGVRRRWTGGSQWLLQRWTLRQAGIRLKVEDLKNHFSQKFNKYSVYWVITTKASRYLSKFTIQEQVLFCYVKLFLNK